MKQLQRSFRLIVFDLDHTLWPFGVDQFVFKPPYSKRKGQVEDAEGKLMQPFPQIPNILLFIEEKKILMGVASRTEYPEGANRLLNMFGFDRYFKFKQIYPGSKVTHFEKFKSQSGIDFQHMLFFDDEERNIVDVSPLGVTAILVNPETGVTVKNVADVLMDKHLNKLI